MEELEKNEAVYHMITNFLSKEIVPTNINTYYLDEFELFRSSFKNHQVLLQLSRNTETSC